MPDYKAIKKYDSGKQPVAKEEKPIDLAEVDRQRILKQYAGSRRRK